MRNLLLLAPLFLAACGADVEGACQNYFDAYTACATEYADANGIDPATVTPSDSVCDAYKGLTDVESATLLNCYADAYNNADCSTADGWTAAGTDVTACAGA
jgi:hypothetical protein